MTNDAKLGLVVGVGLVIVMGVVFFSKDIAPTTAAVEDRAATVVPTSASAPSSRGLYRPVKVKKATWRGRTVEGQYHTVQEGETLFTLAQHYYGDGRKFVDIYQANQDVLPTPDALAPGTRVFIPE